MLHTSILRKVIFPARGYKYPVSNLSHFHYKSFSVDVRTIRLLILSKMGNISIVHNHIFFKTTVFQQKFV